jgi:nucleotide-binding universal stress UspA family protein
MKAKARPRMLVAFDFAEASRAALAEAIRVARATGAELDLLHVFPHAVAPGEYGWPGGEAQREQEHRALQDALEREASDARSLQVLVRIETATGDPAKRILETAGAAKVSAIWMGADAHSGVAGALLGRVTTRVVREAAVPVYVVRLRATASATDRIPDRRVVVGVDFTPASLAAVDAAAAFAKAVGGQVRVVHVIPAVRSVDSDGLSTLRGRVEGIARELREMGVPATGGITYGDPATALVAETEGDTTAVIAVGMHKRSRAARLLLGDVTESLLKIANAGVLVAHAGPAAQPLVALPPLASPG